MSGKKPSLHPRKEPKQERSIQMREDILEGAIRVLQKEGALKFTTPRVAEAAGISVGSLYQYFPNKQALIFALHTRVVEQAWREVQKILDHKKHSPREKVRKIAQMFFVSESKDVSEMGAALQDAEIYFADEPQHMALDQKVLQRFIEFIQEACPQDSQAKVELSAQLLISTLESVGKSVAARGLPRRAVLRWARECADMLSTHIGL